jgi:ABC-type uncharacterized transport system involved in gliding motility auxiliary subunit
MKEAVTGRQAKYGSNAVVLLLALLGILIVINIIVFRNPQRWDLTEDKTHTLAKESVEVLKSLPEPVKAEAYFTTRMSSETARNFLDSYKFSSQGKFDYEFIDPDLEPTRAIAANITRDGTIVLRMGDRKEQISYPGEQEITSSLIKLANPGKRTVYFLTGHGEPLLDGSEDKSYSLAKQSLQAKNYTVETLNLLSTPKIPAEAKALIIAGPQKPLAENEVSLLKNYLDQGGSVVLLVEPVFVTNMAQPEPFTTYLESNWGISLGLDMIVDPEVNPPLIAISQTYGLHPITRPLQNYATLFPTSRSVVEKNPQSDISLTVLVSTSSLAWGETDLASLQNNRVAPDNKVDTMGPVSLAIAGSHMSTDARLVVVGDADFGTNQFFNNYGNGDFLINMIDWAARQDELINLTPKQTTTRSLVAPSILNMGLILLASVFAVPGVVILLGISVYIDRRRRG